MEITKSKIECYKLRSKTSSVWADITIDNLENTGRIQIASDFGSWQYYWGSCGVSFKKFLTQLDIGYTANKFGENRYFDLNETIALLKKYVETEYFPEIDKSDYDLEDEEEKASYEDEVKCREIELEVFDEDFKKLYETSSEQEFISAWWQCEKITEHIERPDMVIKISPAFNRFWNEIWSVFVEELNKELYAENLANTEN